APSKANSKARPAQHVKKSKKKKRKTGIIVLVIVLLLVAGIGVASYFYLKNNGYKGTYGDCTWTLSKDGVMHVSGNGRMEGEFIVSFGIGKPDPATVKEVVIDEGVTYIPEKAFEKMTNLTKVTIPSTVGEIGSGALSKSSSISDIEVSPDNTTFSSLDGSLYSKDQDELIAYASGKTDAYFEVPESVSTIGPEAFDGSGSIENVYLGQGLQSVGSLAFINCPKLLSFEVHSDNMAFSVSEGALFDATGSEIIRYCPAYSDTQYDFANNTIKVAPGAFEGCTKLTSVNFSDGMIAIGNSAFYGCTGLVTADIPESVAYIGDSAFAGCSSLTSSAIPSGITKIPANLYWGCTSITSIVLPENVTSIGEGAFALTSISQIEIPVAVDTIGANAFGGCTGLTRVSIPGGVEEVSDYTFNKCTALSEVVLPATIKSIGYAAFSGCTSLTNVTLPDSVTTVGDFAFYGCSSLTDITIDTAIASVGKAAFDGCSALANANYAGGQSGWNAVSVADNNRPLLSALKYT
ncbi:MAG: leucine-rich repeat domain-containing protein, partial [Clostridiales bacterium]|nr:leucine-rich repeat domain-containing protein [Clostridiales bacterium]